jgi:hypothetical protein
VDHRPRTKGSNATYEENIATLEESFHKFNYKMLILLTKEKGRGLSVSFDTNLDSYATAWNEEELGPVEPGI